MVDVQHASCPEEAGRGKLTIAAFLVIIGKQLHQPCARVLGKLPPVRALVARVGRR